MTKWKRLRKLREKKRFDAEVLRPKAEVTAELTEPEIKLTERTNLGDPQKIKKSKPKPDSKLTTTLAQIPRYAYLLAIFALLAGVFFPVVVSGVSFDFVIQGIAILFLGLIGAILLFKAVTSDTRQGIFIVVGFASITISLVLIYLLREMFMSHYF